MADRFTVDGSEALEKRLAEICKMARAGVAGAIPEGRLQGLLLGGGYGRGEGGVFRNEEGDRPYNDLEFYILMRGSCRVNEWRFYSKLHVLGERLASASGVDVEFKILSQRKLEHSPVGMTYYDLVMGHRLLLGDDALLDRCSHQRISENIPLAEASRLLMNRCTGLLFSKGKLDNESFGPADSEYVSRNHAKAKLGFGDAVLTAFNQYHWSCRERGRRLAALSEAAPRLGELRQFHREGIEFKLHPTPRHCSANAFLETQASLTALGLQLWLWLENRRLGQPFACASDYALSPSDKCPETNGLRNFLINLRTFGFRLSFRYPRERLFNALALLLWEPRTLNDPVLLRKVQRELSTQARGFVPLVGAYENLWRRFN